MKERDALDFGRNFEANRRQLAKRLSTAARGMGLKIHASVEVLVGDQGVLGAAAVSHGAAGLTRDVLRRGVDVALLYIDIPSSDIKRGVYRCHAAGDPPAGKMTLYGSDGARVTELQAKIAFDPTPAADTVCGTGTSSHVDPSGPASTKTVCWAVSCAGPGGVAIVTGCLVSVPSTP